MNNNNQYQKRYILLVLLSFLIHVSAYLVYRLTLDQTEDTILEKKIVTLKLNPRKQLTPEEPKNDKAPEEDLADKLSQEEKPQQEDHAPINNGESFASDNQSKDIEGEIVAGLGTTQPSLPAEILPENNQAKLDDVAKQSASSPRPNESAIPDKLASAPSGTAAKSKVSSNASSRVLSFDTPETGNPLRQSDQVGSDIPEAETAEDIANLLDSELISKSSDSIVGVDQSDSSTTELEIPSDFLDRFGSLKLLGDAGLRDSVVIQPFSEKRSKELTLANKYLERMNRQVLAHWRNPYKGGRLYAGIIRVKISLNGYLEDVRIYRSSGLPYLDESVIRAIKAVKRFEVPDDEIIVARYYSRMSFHYTSIKGETELMPFEKEIANKEDS